jgi:MoxR-like ATPase
MDGRAMPDLDDVAAIAAPVLAHRVVLNFQAEAEGVTAAKVVAGLPKP